MKKFFLTFFLFSFLFSPWLVWGQIPSPLQPEIQEQMLKFGSIAASQALNLPESSVRNFDIRVMIAYIAQLSLSVLGILVIALMVYGGFLWMTSQGEEEKISQAKKILSNSAIALGIILFSYSIALFVQRSLIKAFYNDVLIKAQDPRVGSSCGGLWAHYQSDPTDQNFKAWKDCADKAGWKGGF